MQNTVSGSKSGYAKSIYFSALMLLLFLSACMPKNKSITASPPSKEIIYQDEIAKPTSLVPQASSSEAQYQSSPKKIINIHKTEVFIGLAELKNTKVSYNSIEKKIIITGRILILSDTKNSNKQILSEKDFSLLGFQEKNKIHYTLNDQLDDLREDSAIEKKITVKAEARCLGAVENLNCNHIMVDLYFLYDKKYYTEQIEVNRIHTVLNDIPPSPPAEEVMPPPALPLQNENEDQVDFQQTEDADGSIEGRYQGSAETIDLDKLFIKKDTLPHNIALSPDLMQIHPSEISEIGKIRPANQASGFPDKGYLHNATSILLRQETLSKKAYFVVVTPKRKKYFATYDMSELIMKIGNFLNTQYSKKLYISDLSAASGGKLFFEDKISSHVSHQNGLDVDLGYPTDLPEIKFPLVVRRQSSDYFPKNYALEKTYNLFKFLFTQKDVEVARIFIDNKIKKDLCAYAISKNEQQSKDKEIIQHMFENLQHVDGHGDHFHLRIKCSKYDPLCRARIYKKVESCDTVALPKSY